MLVAFVGYQRAGKTMAMTVLAEYIHKAAGVEIAANYPFYSATKDIVSVDYLMSLKNCIICIDELWLSMDSRKFKSNDLMSQFVLFSRKKDTIVFYTTHNINNVDNRLREATDIVVYCERASETDVWLTFIDWQRGVAQMKFLLNDISRFYHLYDTFAVLKPLV